MRYFTADLHFNDTRMEWYFRPFSCVEEQNETIISKINSCVGEDDELYIVGDVTLDVAGAKMLEKLK